MITERRSADQATCLTMKAYATDSGVMTTAVRVAFADDAEDAVVVESWRTHTAGNR